MPSELETIAFPTEAKLETWLRKHHASSPGIWLKMAKKASGIPSVDYKQALDVALCWGWIDGQSKSIDESWFVQRFTPRTKRSLWSKRNRDNVARLIAEGRMQPAGLAEIERAKSDGRWDAAYDAPSTAQVPDDLTAALAKNKKAASQFAKLDKQNRYAILHRVQTAKMPETRARRIAKFVAMLANGDKLHP